MTACLVVSGAQAAWMLCAGFFLLRLGGQGLMAHTALTATARQFPLDAGKALGAIALGLSLAQALFPVAAVQINHLLGWRTAWLINAAVLVAGVALAVSCLPRIAEKPLPTFRKRGAEKAREISIWRNRSLLLALPGGAGITLHHHRVLFSSGAPSRGEGIGAVQDCNMVYRLRDYTGSLPTVVWAND